MFTVPILELKIVFFARVSDLSAHRSVGDGDGIDAKVSALLSTGTFVQLDYEA